MQIKTPYNYLIVLTLVVLIGVAVFFLKDSFQGPETAEQQPSSSQVSDEELKEITVIGTEFNFNPSEISLETGERVKLIFKNEGRASHNLIIQGLGIGTEIITGGKTDVIEFTVPVSGAYTIFCSLPGHQAAGMEGTLKVE